MTTENPAAIWATAKTYLEKALPEVARLMEEQFAQVQNNPEPGSALDQCGLRNGAKIVSGYMEQNEIGLALEHLCYMVEEVDLPISLAVYAHIEVAAQVMQMDIPALRRITPPAN